VPDATLNDVVVTVIGGAMRRYLQSRGELGDVSPVTIAPVSVREAEARELGGNMVSVMAFPIHTTIDDPLERLAAVQRDSTGARRIARHWGRTTGWSFSRPCRRSSRPWASWSSARAS